MGIRLAQAVLSAFVVLVGAPDVVVPARDVQVVQVVQAAQAAVAAARAVTTVAQAQARAPAFAVDPHGVWPDRPPIAPEVEAEYEFSITMAMAASGDVLPALLNMFLNWMVAACVAGIASLERGKERDNLHIQATVKMKLAHEPTKKDCDTFKRHIKRALGIFQGSGTRTKMDFKPYGPGQNWEMMLGYCTKDAGKQHYRTVLHNVTEAQIALGKAEWNSVRRSYEDAFCVISKKTLYQHVFNSALEDGDTRCTFLSAATGMFNKHHHILAPHMIMNGSSGRMPAAAAEGLWMLITKQSVSEAHVAAMIYSDNSTVTPGAASYGQRYCSDNMGGASSNARKRTIPDSDESDDDGAGVGVTLRARGPSTYQRVRQVLDRGRGVVPTDDFVALDGAPEQASSASQRQVEEEEDAAARAASLDTYAAEQRAAQGKVCCISRIAARARALLCSRSLPRAPRRRRGWSPLRPNAPMTRRTTRPARTRR